MAACKEGKPCELCDFLPPGTWFCVSCDSVFCDACWDKQLPHRKGKKGPTGVAHEKSDWAIAKSLEDILTPVADPLVQQRLHNDDIDTAWFGVVRTGTGALPGLQDYGRYAKLMQASATGEWPERWPQLVSFIGQTGDGKSTLVKMLIAQQLQELKATSDFEFPSPVVGTIGSSSPTSGDVHLYADPESYYSQYPRLYADSEGLKGGEAVPVGDRAKITQTQAELSNPFSENKSRPKLFKKSWDIKWANGPTTRRREFAVQHLYPRFLYTFSNVVVFVLRNERTFEATALKYLLEWASRSIEGSINQPALPHAIIALNACDHLAPDADWDVENATAKLFANIDQTLETNPALSRYLELWKQSGRIITSTQELIKCYYSSFRVVRIPAKGRYMLMDAQVKKLNQEIKNCCIKSHRGKKKRRLDLSADEMADSLQLGFAHFSNSLHRPFDFVELSWNLNPIPQGFAGNILRLALAIKDNDPSMTGPRIFGNLSHMVASCIMLDYARHRIKGTAEQLLRHYKPSLDHALDEFCDRWWPCSYRQSNRECVNTFRGHSKGHQDLSGKVFGNGVYYSDFTADAYRLNWHHMLTENLDKLRRRTERVSLVHDDAREKDTAAEYHLRQMNLFYLNFDDIHRFSNHSACFCCLRELPEHPLPCGHVLCSPCVEAFGKQVATNMWTLDHCPLHRKDMWGWNLKIMTKPRYAGARILCLDGGGMRGIVELQVLAAIEKKLAGMQIQDFFDLIVGTSTGGIIALGLGVKQWPVGYCISRFRAICSNAFTRREFAGIPLFEKMTTLTHQAKYKTRPFEQRIGEVFGGDLLFGGTFNEQRSFTKVAVTATTEAGQGPLIVTNYNRHQVDQLSYKFERPERIPNEFKTWEAARATSAAPPYFKPFTNPRTGRAYLDGALYHNNPVAVADSERRALWSDIEDIAPDLVLSVGTGRNREIMDKERKHQERRKAHMPRHSTDSTSVIERHRKPPIIKLPRIFKILKDRMHTMLDAQLAWDDFRSKAPGDFKRYVRINPELKELPALDQADKLNELDEEVREVLRRRNYVRDIEDIVQRLIASSFYFEKSLARDEQDVTGRIRCRFEPQHHKLSRFGERLRMFNYNGFVPYMTIIENYGQDAELTSIKPLDSKVLHDMTKSSVFDMGETTIHCPTSQSETMITLCLTREKNHLPISGFPRRLMAEDQLHALREKQRLAAVQNPNSRSYTTPSSSPRTVDFPENMSELDSEAIPGRSSWSGFETQRPMSDLSDTSRSVDGASLRILDAFPKPSDSSQPKKKNSTAAKITMAGPISERVSKVKIGTAELVDFPGPSSDYKTSPSLPQIPKHTSLVAELEDTSRKPSLDSTANPVPAEGKAQDKDMLKVSRRSDSSISRSDVSWQTVSIPESPLLRDGPASLERVRHFSQLRLEPSNSNVSRNVVSPCSDSDRMSPGGGLPSDEGRYTPSPAGFF